MAEEKTKTRYSDEELAELVLNLREDNALCLIHEEQETQDPQILCTMGLVQTTPE